MTNAEIAAAFEELAERLALTDQKPFRYMAYRTAAKRFSRMSQSVELLARRGELIHLDGVGPAIADKVLSLVDTGSFTELDEARRDVPDGLLELTRVDGVGGKTAHAIWAAAGGEEKADGALNELFAAAEAGTLPPIPGVGPKVLTALGEHAHARRTGTLVVKGATSGVPRGADGEPLAGPWFTRAHARDVERELQRLLTEEIGREVRVVQGGEYARGMDVVRGAMVLVVATPPASAAEVVAALEQHGWSVKLRGEGGAEAVSPSGVPTGIAPVPAPEVEEPMLEALSSPPEWAGSEAAHVVPPVPLELRERVLAGDLALEGVPTRLLEEADLVGDLHSHSTWSDGDEAIIDMARAARARGDQHLVVTDHSAPYSLVNGLGRDRLLEQAEEIAAANEQLETEAKDGAPAFWVFQGSEVEILADGTLGLDDDTLGMLDWVVASIHQAQGQSEAKLRERMERVLANPLVDQIGHPTSRLVLRRDPTALDVAWLIERAAEERVVLEINANPARLDLRSDHAAAAISCGVRLAINTDAHATSELDNRMHGVAVARRAGATREHVVNCLTWKQLQAARRRVTSKAASGRA